MDKNYNAQVFLGESKYVVKIRRTVLLIKTSDESDEEVSDEENGAD